MKLVVLWVIQWLLAMWLVLSFISMALFGLSNTGWNWCRTHDPSTPACRVIYGVLHPGERPGGH